MTKQYWYTVEALITNIKNHNSHISLRWLIRIL